MQPNKTYPPIVWTLDKIISGGQVGVDIAALTAAELAGIPTGGFMPYRFMTKAGPKPEYQRRFHIQETARVDYPHRTKLNIEHSDGTILFAQKWDSPGTALTLRLLKRYEKPFMCCHVNMAFRVEATHRNVANFLKKENIKILNVAGNSNYELEKPVHDWLYQLFMKMRKRNYDSNN